MAAVYTTGSNAVSATPAADMRTAIDAAILAHPNWSLVEAISITGGTARVYKCSGSGANANSWGADFYVALTIFTATPTQLNFQTFESYTAAPTSQAVRGCRASGTASTAAPGSNSGFVIDNTGYTLDTGAANLDRRTVTFTTNEPWVYMVHVSKSRIEASYRGGTSSLFGQHVAGVYVPNPRTVTAMQNVFPLVQVATTGSGLFIGGSSGGQALAFSRNYASGGAATGGFYAASSPTAVGTLATAGALLDPIENTVRGCGIVAMGGAAGSATTSPAGGYLRGSLPGLYGFYHSNTPSQIPGPLDLVLLSDGTRLATVGGGTNAGLYVNVDSDY